MTARMNRETIKRFWRRFADWYRTCAIMCFTTLVLFALLNGALAVVFKIKDAYVSRGGSPVEDLYGESRLVKVHPEFQDREELKQMLNETGQLVWEFEPYTQYKERPLSGRWVNIDANGWRRTKDQGPWPPDPGNLNVFLFGGSTTLGYWAADEHTIASFLQDLLQDRSTRKVKVYNFGRGGYYSTQERILFEKLLVQGFVPDVALFFDGINDCYFWDDKPEYSDTLEAVFAVDIRRKSDPPLRALVSELPVARATRAAQRRLGIEDEAARRRRDVEERFARKKEAYKDEKTSTNVVERYFRTKRLIEAAAGAYGVTPVFVWQPSPSYKYDQTYHLFKGDQWTRDFDFTAFGCRPRQTAPLRPGWRRIEFRGRLTSGQGTIDTSIHFVATLATCPPYAPAFRDHLSSGRSVQRYPRRTSYAPGLKLAGSPGRVLHRKELAPCHADPSLAGRQGPRHPARAPPSRTRRSADPTRGGSRGDRGFYACAPGRPVQGVVGSTPVAQIPLTSLQPFPSRRVSVRRVPGLSRATPDAQ